MDVSVCLNILKLVKSIFQYCDLISWFVDKEVNVDNVFELLVDQCGFDPSLWYELARYLKVPHEERRQIEAKRDDCIKLEDALCYWITNTDQPSWAELVEAVKKCKMTDVATKMRETLHIDWGNWYSYLLWSYLIIW